MTKNKKSSTLFNKKTTISLVGILLIGMIGFSFAYFARTKTQDDPNVYQSGSLELRFVNDTNALLLEDTYPISDEAGLNQEDRYNFDIENTGTLKASYRIKLKETLEGIDQNDVANRSLIKIVLFDANNPNTQLTAVQTVANIISNNNVIYEAELDADESHSYFLKMWLAEEAENDQIGKTYSSKIELEAIQE